MYLWSYNSRYNIEILTILGHYFKEGHQAATAVHKNLEGNEKISDHTAPNWLKHFKLIIAGTSTEILAILKRLKTSKSRRKLNNIWLNFKIGLIVLGVMSCPYHLQTVKFIHFKKSMGTIEKKNYICW